MVATSPCPFERERGRASSAREYSEIDLSWRKGPTVSKVRNAVVGGALKTRSGCPSGMSQVLVVQGIRGINSEHASKRGRVKETEAEARTLRKGWMKGRSGHCQCTLVGRRDPGVAVAVPCADSGLANY